MAKKKITTNPVEGTVIADSAAMIGLGMQSPQRPTEETNSPPPQFYNGPSPQPMSKPYDKEYPGNSVKPSSNKRNQ